MANYLSRITGWASGKKSRRLSIDFLEGNDDFQPLSLHTNIGIKDYIFNDPDLASNIRRLVDNILLNNPVLAVMEDETMADSTLKKYEKQLADVRFYKKLRAAVYSLVWSGNAFFEIRKNGRGELKELDIIDSEYMKAVKDTKGKITGYVQEIPNHVPIKFDIDEIVHITIDHLDSGVFGKSFIGALEEALNRKAIAESYLSWVISKNKLNRFWLVQGDMNEDDWGATVDMLRYSSLNPDKTTVINVSPDVEVTFNRYFDTEDFQAIRDYIDEQKQAILSVLQVPPIIGGNVDASNRSNSEVQARVVFYNTIRNFQRHLVEELNYELLRTLNWNKLEFKFPHSDRSITAEIFKIATAMQGLGFSQDAVLEYLKDEGFKVPKVDEIFEPKVDMMGMGMDATGRNPMAPTASREPRSKAGLPQNEEKRKSDQKAKVTQDAN